MIPTRKPCFRPAGRPIPARSDAVSPADGPRGRPVPAGRGNVGVSVAVAWQSRAFFMLMALLRAAHPRGQRPRRRARRPQGPFHRRSIPRPVAAGRPPVGDEVAAERWNATNGPANASETTVPRSFVTSTGNPVSPGMPGVEVPPRLDAGRARVAAGKRPRPSLVPSSTRMS